MEMSLSDFVAELAHPGVSAILQVRHAERPRIDPNDPSFGDELPITDEGVRTSRRLGEALAPFAAETTFWSSPLRRTVMTAEMIAAGMGIEVPTISKDGRLGNETFYFADPAEVLDVFKPENFFNACFEYYRVGTMRGFHEIHTASDELERWLIARHNRKLLIATTHDCYIAAFLAAKAGYVFSRETWPRFLDGGAMIINADGTIRHVLVRTGLSSGICGVGGKVM